MTRVRVVVEFEERGDLADTVPDVAAVEHPALRCELAAEQDVGVEQFPRVTARRKKLLNGTPPFPS